MKRIQILPLGVLEPELLPELAAGLAQEFGLPCEILSGSEDPAFAFNLARQQYSSTEILLWLSQRTTPDTWRILGVTSLDLYIPILTFVFGEAQLAGPCAVVSLCRLRADFYGMPGDKKLLQERLLKEAVHELGHTHGASHCEDYECVMSRSHGVEWIDLKSSHFCAACRSILPSRAELNAPTCTTEVSGDGLNS